MAINRSYRDGFIRQVEAAHAGDVTYIPVQLDRMGEVFNLLPSRYTLLFGATGSGKTSFMDFTWILSPYKYIKKHNLDIHWEVNYFSLERKKMFKHAKWCSWMMYADNAELLVSADQIMGWQGSPINSEGLKLVRSYDEEMSDLLEYVKIYDGKTNAKLIKEVINERARELGDLFKSDGEGVLFNDELVYIARFTDKGLFEETKRGREYYIDVEHQDYKFRMYKNDHIYFTFNPKTFVFFCIDGINLLGSKEEMDAISVELADARDIYGFSPIVVSQQNRGQGDIQRQKHHGSDMSPQIEDAFKSSQMGFDADLIIGMFDAHRYKAWDNEGKFGGYVINPPNSFVGSMLAPKGFSRFRSVHFLKNSFGIDGVQFGLKFLGECNHFCTLPPADSLEMDAIYADIRRGI